MKKAVKKFIENKKEKNERLSTQNSASALVSKYIQLYEADKIEAAKFRNLMYGCKIFSEIIRNHWLDEADRRLKELESRQSTENDSLIFEGWQE